MLKCLNKIISFPVFLAVVALITVEVAVAQKPTHGISDSSNTPIDLNNVFDWVIFIILPVIFFVLFLVWRKRMKKEKEKLKSEENNPKNNS